jgi:two-component system sensor histidine kinase CiaH
MFQSARVKLTAWYLLIITLISFLFSFVIYSDINHELERFKHFQEVRLEREKKGTPLRSTRNESPSVDLEMVISAQNRLKLILVLVNIGILGVSGFAAYFLAGRTLKPIKEMVEEQNRFITDASHELRTPLTSLRSEIEVNLRDHDLTLPIAKDLLKSNLEEVINLHSLSDHLMNLAQYEKKNGDFTYEELSIKEVVKESIQRVLPLSQIKKITINNDAKDYVIKGNRQSLVELFIILLDNAIKYSSKNNSVDITSQTTDNEIVVSIKDEGEGINESDISHIFDRFYRADKSRSKEKISGYGLGLSIAKKIIELHKGKIEVKSTIGVGSTFIVHLPQI